MSKPARKKELGQALVEMAISLPVLILLLSGLLDLGRIYYTFIALEEAAAEAARYLAIEPNCPGAQDYDTSDTLGNPCVDPNNALFRASNAGNGEFVAADADWNIPYDPVLSPTLGFDDPFEECAGVVSIGCIVKVQVSYPYEFITPGIEAIASAVTAGEGLFLRVQATEIMVYE